MEETLKALALVKERLGVKTVLGVSNVSYGLPNRELVNKVFFAAALYEGLDLPIINPLDREMMDTILASNLLWNRDKGGKVYLENYKKIPQVEKSKAKAKANLDLVDIIIKGMRDEARAATQELLTTKEPLDIVNEYIVPTLDLVGDRYEKGEIFLPQLIQSAETVKSSFEVIKESLSRDSGEAISKGKIILATVKGDIHDIGKNIVKVLLENYNYEVIDLGKDVPSEVIVEEAIRQDIQLVGLSALMTTTVKSMEETIAQLKRDKPNIKIMVGGAVLNQDYADMIKADYYAKDAKGAVEIARKFF